MEELYSFIIDFGFVKYFSTYIFLKVFERFGIFCYCGYGGVVCNFGDDNFVER